ncbi:RDD family protein [Luteolibacter soli]|uniref:RDD family protein n=1 Tax=Luteolibacter soli TaxID=3135280 RepID=A0ABU9B0I5_9BACT
MHPWYYAQAGQQHGPISKEDLQSKFGAGTLEPDALVWSQGMTEWKPANSVAGLWVSAPPPAPPSQAPSSSPVSLSPYAPPAAAPLSEVDWNGHTASGYVPEGSQIRPWIRYWARTFDSLGFLVFFGTVTSLVAPELSDMGNLLDAIVFFFAYSVYETVLLTLFGTTPFKSLLRVRLRNQDGTRLSFGQALRRTLSVLLFGQGLGIPLIALIATIYSYNRLTNQGITSWDQAGNLAVSHRPVQWWRWLILTGFFAFIVGLIVLNTLLEQEAV